MMAELNTPTHLLCNQMGHGHIHVTQRYYLAVSDDSISILRNRINPLVENKKECEIEHLFTEETRAQIIGGKQLCLKDDFDIQKFYGKEIFSQHISQNYTQIDFDGFKPLLNALLQIVRESSKVQNGQ